MDRCATAEHDSSFALDSLLRYYKTMKKKSLNSQKKTLGIGPERMKPIIKIIRKRYGPMLKRLAR
jgi:hypothetical protein